MSDAVTKLLDRLKDTSDLQGVEPEDLTTLIEMVEVLREFSLIQSRKKCKLIVKEDESPRATIFIDETSTISFYAGELIDLGYQAKSALARIEELAKGVEE